MSAIKKKVREFNIKLFNNITKNSCKNNNKSKQQLSQFGKIFL